MTIQTWPTTKDGRYLILRTCNADMQGRGGFQWPTSGMVEAPDWDPNPGRDCGGGLHGLLWGCGNAGLLSSATDARWLIVAVDPADIATRHDDGIPGKVRFRKAEVIKAYKRRDAATAYLLRHGANGLPVVYATSTSGDRGTSTSGDEGTSTSGDWGTLVVKWWDGSRYRLTVGYVGEDGIKANTPYHCDELGVLVEGVAR